MAEKNSPKFFDVFLLRNSISGAKDSLNIKISANFTFSSFSRGGGDQVPSAGHHVGGWVIFSPKNTVSTWY